MGKQGRDHVCRSLNTHAFPDRSYSLGSRPACESGLRTPSGRDLSFIGGEVGAPSRIFFVIYTGQIVTVVRGDIVTFGRDGLCTLVLLGAGANR